MRISGEDILNFLKGGAKAFAFYLVAVFFVYVYLLSKM